MRNRSIFLALLLMLVFPAAAFSFYVPADVGLRALGRGNVQALESEFRAMQQAALIFRAEDSAAGNLQEGVNHIAYLSGYTDNPGHYSDEQSYGLLVDSRGWWLGVAAPEAESMREYVQAAADRGWFGSPDTSTPPGNDTFQTGDAIVWKLLR